ncbi:MAG: prolipoprotein diacylglyceryl transferase [Firmicutes bacterium]|nr:prolipoprotein diacylglyceryl transferase [Bacillota bacterium]MCL5038823.1 prolipoprotein diacylglyceryl transferase [Bacillota bacterium]
MHPIVFSFGSFEVHTWGVMFALAFLLGTALAMLEAGRRGLDPNLILDLALYTSVAAIVGARLLFVLLEWPYYSGNPISVLWIREGGLSLHGGLLGGVLVGLWFAGHQRIPKGRLADIVAPSVAIGTMVARFGCFFEGCCYGTLTEGWWGTLTRYAPGLRHPAQLYEAALDLVLFLFLWFWRKRVRVPGQLFLLYIGLYSVIRFGVEFFREVPHLYGWLTVAQLASLVIAALAFVWYHWLGARTSRLDVE